MADVTAACASFASLTVTSLVAFSSPRAFAASAMATSRSLMASLRSPISCASFASRAASSSAFAARSEASALSVSRACLLVDSSWSHHPLWSASSLASSISLTSRSLIIFLTFAKGSSPARIATVASRRLLALWARCVRKATAFCRKREAGLALALALRSCARAVAGLLTCSSADGRYFSPEPATSGLEMTSMALSIASSSSRRSTWRSS
mmetsp:Transcript_78048/g.200999  ORF Transcript_78048/g.200999 Transcript_78048/m.200999 type:complete len:210 (-) Transcript_78048:766-1395(-)